mmetsp:Transcript_14936/g.50281  ORF Transcript_14936/g.50281 Transcript_14936/m.50281 type:complete len:158 (+) Transcript_14936:740-1213(+)
MIDEYGMCFSWYCHSLRLDRLGALAQSAQRGLVVVDGGEGAPPRLREEESDDGGVEVCPAEERVPGGGEHLDGALVAELQHRHVVRSGAEVEDEHLADRPAEAVGERGGDWLREQRDRAEPGEPGRCECRLPLRRVEVGGHGHDCAADLARRDVERP